jgi:hypothetical protein
MANGDILLDEDGNRKLDNDGNIMLDDGAGNDCECGCGEEVPTCTTCRKCCISTSAVFTWENGPESMLTFVEEDWPDYEEGVGFMNEIAAEWANVTFPITLNYDAAMAWMAESAAFSISEPLFSGNWKFVYRFAPCVDSPSAQWSVDVVRTDGPFVGEQYNVLSHAVGDASESQRGCCTWTLPNTGPTLSNRGPDGFFVSISGGGPFVFTISNNKCCNCAGGDCVPTSDGSTATCDSGDENANNCTGAQDDDCPP